MEYFKVTMGDRRVEFSVIGIGDVGHDSVRFQGLMNGIPFTQGGDYEKIRARVMRAIELNEHEANSDLN